VYYNAFAQRFDLSALGLPIIECPELRLPALTTHNGRR
jgi:hypothetical protein